MIKGSNLHVMPYHSGWCVISESNQKVMNHFNTQEQALQYAADRARIEEGGVLLHSTPSYEGEELSTVALPQQENLPDAAHLSAPGNLTDETIWDVSGGYSSYSGPILDSFDPLLGFDESYFEI